MRCLVGIDDTDNLESRGTGFRARQLGARMVEAGFGVLRGVTRHQLYVHPSIPYTSHNSSACLDLDLHDGAVEAARDFCRAYLADESAPGSDAGLCMAAFDAVPEELVNFGRAAKQRVLDRAAAHGLADRHGVHLEGVTGDLNGVIGALAAVGLRRGGHDGRFIWAKGVRELAGTATAATLLATTGIDSVESLDGRAVPPEARVIVDPWPRPVLLHDRAVLLAEETGGADGNGDWRILSKEAIRRY